MNIKKSFIIILCSILFFSLLLVGCTEKNTEENKLKTEIYRLVDKGRINEAKEKVRDYYDGDEIEIQAWLNTIDTIAEINNEIAAENKSNSSSYLDCLGVQSGWTWEKKGDYIYVNGSVENIGYKTIRYFKLTAQFLDDSGKVLDSNYTLSSLKLKSGDSKKFEIMHKYDSDYKQVKLIVEEVKFN